MDGSQVCIICGTTGSKAEPLKCPVDSGQKYYGFKVYTAFKEIYALPVSVKFGPEVVVCRISSILG